MSAPLTAKGLLPKLKTLPPERLGQVADFIDFLAVQERRRLAGKELRAMMDKLAVAGLPSMTEDEIQAEIGAARKARKTSRRA